MTDSMERLIEKIKEAPHPMPRLYRQGWQDACSKISEEIRNSPSGGSDRVVREVVAASAMTDDIKSAVTWARENEEIARCMPEWGKAHGKELAISRALLHLASRVEKIEAETVERCAKVADLWEELKAKYEVDDANLAIMGDGTLAEQIRALSQPKE
jgi:hypothetical protein